MQNVSDNITYNYLSRTKMKKFLVILFIFVTYNLFGQSLGFKAGADLNNISIHGDYPQQYHQDTQTSIGFHFGIFSEILISSKVKLTPELQFAQRGFKYTSDLVQVNQDVRENLNYLELPILLTYYPSQTIGIQVGPNISYLISSKSVTDGNSFNNYDIYDKFDIGISAGIRVEIFNNLFVFGRYNYGLIKISETYYSPDEQATWFNRNIQFGLGYRVK